MATPAIRTARTSVVTAKTSAGSLLLSKTTPFSSFRATTHAASYTTRSSRSFSKEICPSRTGFSLLHFNLHRIVHGSATGSSRVGSVRQVSGFGFSGFDGGAPIPGRSKWDLPEKTSGSTIADQPSSSTSLSQSTSTSTGGAWDAIKDDIHKELSNAPEDSQSNIESNLKKLAAISRGKEQRTASKHRLKRKNEFNDFLKFVLTSRTFFIWVFFKSCLVLKKKQAYSPYLVISQLPSTVMPDDIQRMALTEDSIVDIIYHRNQYMEFRNRVTVVFRSATDAVEFLTQKYGKFLAGHKLNMSMVR